MNRKLFISAGLLLFINLCTFFLMPLPGVLIAVYLLIGLAKYKLYPIKQELLWFVLVFICATIVEVVLVNYRHAWEYANPQFFGIPYWIQFYWAVTGTTIISLYEGFTEKN